MSTHIEYILFSEARGISTPLITVSAMKIEFHLSATVSLQIGLSHLLNIPYWNLTGNSLKWEHHWRENYITLQKSC
jgi:hypothetical protein